MIPIVLDGSRVEVALVGRGPAFLSRLRWLDAAGAVRLVLFTDEPVATEHRVVARMPAARDLGEFDLVWITGVDEAEAAPLARATRRLGPLVNVEDVRPLCDVHTPAVVRRGDLLVAISTGGRSPGLASRVRRWLDAQLSADWSERLDRLSAKRDAWRRRRRPLDELARLTDAAIDARGWLPTDALPAEKSQPAETRP